MTKIAHYRACRARPELRAPDSYDIAVQEWRAAQAQAGSRPAQKQEQHEQQEQRGRRHPGAGRL
jgi:hypothetical protein